MAKVKLTIKESRCRCGYFTQGETFIVDDLCPPLCHELWNIAYPYVFALKNGAVLDKGNIKSKSFTCLCPDGGKVILVGEIADD